MINWLKKVFTKKAKKPTVGDLATAICDRGRGNQMAQGSRCWMCGERYVGLAMDCACTNWGR